MSDFTLFLMLLTYMYGFYESFDLLILMYYTIVLTNYVLILREIFGIMSIIGRW